MEAGTRSTARVEAGRRCNMLRGRKNSADGGKPPGRCWYDPWTVVYSLKRFLAELFFSSWGGLGRRRRKNDPEEDIGSSRGDQIGRRASSDPEEDIGFGGGD